MFLKTLRRAGIASALSVVTPGLGQLYNGQLFKGSVIFITYAGFVVLASVLGLAHNFKGLIFFLAISILCQLLILLEAARTAWIHTRSNKIYGRTWPLYIVSALLLSTTMIISIRHVVPDKVPGLRAYKIDSSSMAPTIDAGDRIVADMAAYRNLSPRRGDLTIFRIPGGNAIFVKRVVAVGGDIVSMRGQSLMVNGRVLEEAYAHYDSAGSKGESSDFGPQTVPELSLIHI